MITSTKLYVPFVTLSLSWNKYISERTTKPKNNNLDYLIDPTFRNINRKFALSFKNGKNDQPFLDEPAKNKQEAY